MSSPKVTKSNKQISHKTGSKEPSSLPRSSEEAGVKVTHPDRIIYAKQGIAKGDLARYYESVSEWILPHLKQRPLTLVKCPRGQAEDCFYQKHVNERVPETVDRVEISGKEIISARPPIGTIVASCSIEIPLQV